MATTPSRLIGGVVHLRRRGVAGGETLVTMSRPRFARILATAGSLPKALIPAGCAPMAVQRYVAWKPCRLVREGAPKFIWADSEAGSALGSPRYRRGFGELRTDGPPGIAAVWRVRIRVRLLDLIIPGSWVRAPPAPLLSCITSVDGSHSAFG
jgi:hypothetical protein